MRDLFHRLAQQGPQPIPGGGVALWSLILLAAVALTQTGSLLVEVIDWDESTFILMAADMVRGHLPYVHIYDIKPPGMFAALAGVMLLAGESLAAIRVFGDLCLLVAVLAALVLALRRTQPLAAGLGLTMAVAVMAHDFGLYTSSELPATACVMAALVVMIRAPGTLWAAALAGLLISLATLIRPNLVMLVLAWGLYYLIAAVVGPRRGWVIPRGAVLAYGLAGLLPLGVVIAAYGAAGELALLRLAVVDVSLAYSSEQFSMLGAGKRHLLHLIDYTLDRPLIWLPFYAAVLAGIVVFALRLRRGAGDEILIALSFAAILWSILQSGGDYPHYWLQFLPLCGYLAALGIDAALSGLRGWRRQGPVIVLAALPIVGALADTVGDTVTVLTRPDILRERHVVRAAADTIAADRAPEDTLWTLYNQLAHWYLDMPLLSRIATHPSNIVRRPILQTLSASGYVTDDEAARLMALEPDYIIDDTEWRARVPYLTNWGYDIDGYLADRYALIATHGPVRVYRHLRHDEDKPAEGGGGATASDPGG